jgi:ribonuclease HI
MPKVVKIYTDGACSGNPGLFAPEAAELRGRVGARDCVASRRMTRPGCFEISGVIYV